MLKQITAMQKSAWGSAAVFLGAAAGTVVQERQPQLPAGTFAPSGGPTALTGARSGSARNDRGRTRLAAGKAPIVRGSARADNRNRSTAMKQSEEHLPLKEDQAPVKEGRAPLREDQAPLQEDQAPLKEDRANLEEDRANLEEDRAPLKELDEWDDFVAIRYRQGKSEEEFRNYK